MLSDQHTGLSARRDQILNGYSAGCVVTNKRVQSIVRKITPPSCYNGMSPISRVSQRIKPTKHVYLVQQSCISHCGHFRLVRLPRCAHIEPSSKKRCGTALERRAYAAPAFPLSYVYLRTPRTQFISPFPTTLAPVVNGRRYLSRYRIKGKTWLAKGFMDPAGGGQSKLTE